ncbi:DUF4153 domain-containing protein [Flavisericum labens]|uniref:DUF4153 domain-containing protein n=1 Tax=Flavisericum labens TaxID=3377112 RepID=UPI00387B03E0
MKKASLIISALMFSSLFYDKTIGINLLLFSLITIAIIFLNNKNSFRNKNTILYSTIYLITGLAVFFHDSILTIIANLVSFLTLIGMVSKTRSSIYINWINGLYSTIAGMFHRKFSEEEKYKEQKADKAVDYIHLIKIIGIPIIVVIIFIVLYKNGNPLFNGLIEKIDFSFINLHWLFMVGLGYYLFSNIHKPVNVEPATELDLKTGNSLFKSDKFSAIKLQKENQMGLVLISLLNALIIIYLITDIMFLTNNMDLRASVFSIQVHSSINALIVSIVIAIVILLYVFRGDLNFFKENTTLKQLALLWIILNTLLVISIVIKNGQYIYYYGLTYKRIGVMVYLALSLIGLISTLIKITQLKNTWYLFRLNVKTVFIVLIACSTINWDYQITSYNFKYAQSLDFNYLVKLSDNNTFLLKELTETKNMDKKSISIIERKYERYIKRLKSNAWQELLYDNLKIKEN